MSNTPNLMAADTATDDFLLAINSGLPGFCFRPSNEDLMMYHLKRKVMGKSLHPKIISEVDVYKYAPWDLPDKSYIKPKDLKWYFFCPRSRKFPSGARSNRATEFGFWKSTGIDRTVYYQNRVVGKIKTLTFHSGKAPHKDRTNWFMDEYRLEDKDLALKGVPQDSYLICKVYKKNCQGLKNGVADFVEWDIDDEPEDMESDGSVVTVGTAPALVSFQSEFDQLTSTLETQHVPVSPSHVDQIILAEPEEHEIERLLDMFIVEEPVAQAPGADIPTGAEENVIEKLLDMFTTEEESAVLVQAIDAADIFTGEENDIEKLLAMFTTEEELAASAQAIVADDNFMGEVEKDIGKLLDMFTTEEELIRC